MGKMHSYDIKSLCTVTNYSKTVKLLLTICEFCYTIIYIKYKKWHYDINTECARQSFGNDKPAADLHFKVLTAGQVWKAECFKKGV